MVPPSRLQTPPMGPSATDANQPPGAEAPSNARAIADILTRFVKYHPQRIDLSLDRMYRLLDDLDNPHATLPPVIHVAGTNGKGSTLAFLDAALVAAGLRVSAYTSPHLVRFAERYRIAGEIIADTDLLALFEEIDERNAGKPITEFEITTAAAFLAMARTSADVVLLETGLGGRYDATNVVVQPVATIITPVGFDHMAFLGNTLAEIAGEKAAIQKPGVPSIVASQAEEAANVIAETAAATGAPLHRCGKEWRFEAADGGLRYIRGDTAWDLAKPSLPGGHQIENASLAAACLEICSFPGVSAKTVADGISNARWPGRMQQLTEGALVDPLPPGSELWLDTAHNPMAAEALAATLDDLQRTERRPVHLILAMLDDKDVGGFIAPLTRHLTSVTAVPIEDEPRARSASDLVAALANLGRPARAAPTVTDAVSLLSRNRGPARVVVTGSHLLVGAALAANG